MGGLYSKIQHRERKFQWLSQYVDFDKKGTELQGLVEREQNYIFGAVIHGDTPAERHQAVLFHEKGSKDIKLAGLPIGFPQNILWKDFRKNAEYESLRNATGLTEKQIKAKEEMLRKQGLVEKPEMAIIVYVLVKVDFNIGDRFFTKGQFGYGSPTVSELAQFYEAVGKKLDVDHDEIKNKSIQHLLDILNSKSKKKKVKKERSNIMDLPSPEKVKKERSNIMDLPSPEKGEQHGAGGESEEDDNGNAQLP